MAAKGGQLKEFSGVMPTVPVMFQPELAPTRIMPPAITIKIDPVQKIAQFTKKDGTNLTTDEAHRLLNTIMKNGEPAVSLDESKSESLFEVGKLLMSNDLESVISYITQAENDRDLIWRSDTLRDARHQFEVAKMIDQKPIEGVKGIGTCAVCKNDEFYMATLQTRSADEPMTVIKRCTACGTRDKIIPPKLRQE